MNGDLGLASATADQDVSIALDSEDYQRLAAPRIARIIAT